MWSIETAGKTSARRSEKSRAASSTRPGATDVLATTRTVDTRRSYSTRSGSGQLVAGRIAQLGPRYPFGHCADRSGRVGDPASPRRSRPSACALREYQHSTGPCPRRLRSREASSQQGARRNAAASCCDRGAALGRRPDARARPAQGVRRQALGQLAAVEPAVLARGSCGASRRDGREDVVRSAAANWRAAVPDLRRSSCAVPRSLPR